MSPLDSIPLFLSLRSLHILAAATWVGAAALVSVVLFPALGRGAPEVIAKLVRARLPLFMAGAGATTLFSGLILYWRILSAGVAGNHAAIVFGIGGVLGVAAAIVGRAVVATTAARITVLFEAAEQPDARGGTASTSIEVLQRRMRTAAKAGLGLKLAALLLMSVGHYL